MPPPPPPPSNALREWDTARRSKLDKLESQCVWAAALMPADPDMEGEHLRAYVTLLSAHFQGFCRDIYTEATVIVMKRVRGIGLQQLVQAQVSAELRLERGNPTLDNLTADFRRLGIPNLRTAIGTGPPADAHKGRLAAMNDCRNKCAHGVPIISELLLANIRDWRTSCDWLASEMNVVVYHALRAAFRSAPW